MSHTGSALVDALVDAGVRWAACVPGESFLPLIDGFRDRADDVRLVTFRHEASAGQSAVAQARRTGRAGVCAVTRGPGALHAAIAVHTADQDALPLLLLVGQIDSGDRGRGAFQEISCAAVFGSMAKWVTSIDRPERAAETIARAVRIAEGGRPGPVVIELPEDVLYLPAPETPRRPRPVPIEPVEATGIAARVDALLQEAQRPIVLLGRGRWGAEEHRLAAEFAAANQLPVAVGFRCQDYIDNAAPCYVGHLGFAASGALVRSIATADLVIAIGGHFGDVETDGYARPIGAPDARIVHLAASEHDLDRTLPASLATVIPARDALRSLAGIRHEQPRWAAWTASLRDAEERFSIPVGDDRVAEMMALASAMLPEDAVVCNGAGNYALWVHRFHRFRRFGTQLAPAVGAMGFGGPAAIAGCVDAPAGTVVVAYAGDGCFTMALPELATIVAEGLHPILVVIDNGVYGTIQAHQRRRFPDRPYATGLTNPDWVALAGSYGIAATRVAAAGDFERALRAAIDSGAAHLIHVVADPERLAPSVAPE